MKKLFVLSVFAVMTAVFAGCNSGNANVSSDSVCSLLQRENDSLKSVIRNQPTEAEIHAKVRAEIDAEETAMRQSTYYKHLDTLDFRPMPMFTISQPQFNTAAIEEMQRIPQNAYGFAQIPYTLAGVIGTNKEALQSALENKYVLGALLKANQAVGPQVLEGLGLYHVSKNWANQLLPYFEGTSPYIKHFDLYFANMEAWEHAIGKYDETVEVGIVQPEFMDLMEKTGLTDNELDKQYKLYLFAKRRMAKGLKEECTEILKFLVNLPTA